ncbi:vesicle-associated membrane protein 2-like isoform X2 [Aphelocoma coerulescens]|uniref:vesicle-associated membrane protein 2-like isoform X2 n=1 Tax=Aphelocoma coerulescens TaxID=39617 RepID=UPI0036049D58
MSVPASTQGPTGAAGAAGPPPATNVSSNKRLQQTQAQVDEVVDIMRMNVDKVLERDQKLSELDNRADALQAGASQFETSAAKLKRKYWWKNCKMMIILGVVCAVILIIIIRRFLQMGNPGRNPEEIHQKARPWILFLHLKKQRRKTWHNFVHINRRYQCSFVELRFLIPDVLGFLLVITHKHSVWCILEFCCFHKKPYQLNTAK